MLQIVTIASNITAAISVCFRMFSSNNEPKNSLITSLPLIKQDGLNLTINIIMILYTIGTMIVVVKLFSYHIEILIKDLTTYQDIKYSMLELEEKKLPFFFLTRNESRINFESKAKYLFYLFKKKILFRIKKAFFIPYEYYKNESNENIEFLQTAVAVINNNQNIAAANNNYNSIPSSALSNMNPNIKNKFFSEGQKERSSEETKDKNLNVNFPCNQIKELITNNYNFNSNSNSNSEINSRNNNKFTLSGNLNTKSASLSKSHSRGKAAFINNYDENFVNNIDNLQSKVINEDNQISNSNNNSNKLNYLINKIPHNNKKVSKNMQKRMNQFLLNHNILNFENILGDYSVNKDKNNLVGSLNSINRQNFSSIYSSNLNENNINLGEIHLSEREKNNLNHVLNENNHYSNKDKIPLENNKLIQRYLYNNNHFNSKINNPSTDTAAKNHSDGNYEELKKFNLNENGAFHKENQIAFDKNKNVPRHFRINSNIENLNQMHLNTNLRQTGEIVTQSNIFCYNNHNNNFDSNRNALSGNVCVVNHNNNNPNDILKNNRPKGIKEASDLILIERSFNEVENNSKKSLNEKIISIINSSGTVDDIDLSENGTFQYFLYLNLII